MPSKYSKTTRTHLPHYFSRHTYFPAMYLSSTQDTLTPVRKLPIASLDRCTRCWFWSNSDAIIFVLHIISLTCSDVILYHTSNYQITKITWMFLTLSPDQAFFLENYRINDEMAINIYLPHNFTRKSRPYIR